MTPLPTTLGGAACTVLRTADAREKAEISRLAAAAWAKGALALEFTEAPPERPARPARPQLLLPRDMPKRRAGGTLANRIALLHAVAHIELNAIDLAWDMVARFAHEDPPRSFFDDWVRVGDDEARHFLMLSDRLEALGAAYGDLPAHDGLWQAAVETAHDIKARLAIVPLILEARGLDVTPAMIERFRKYADEESAAALTVIFNDEISHVAAGKRWLDHFCAREKIDPRDTFQSLVRRHFRGDVKPPFNEPARSAADFPADFYAPLAAENS